MASQAGGMEIEEVAAKDPDAIFKAYIDPAVGFQPYQARKLAFALGLKPTQINDAVKFMTGLYKVFLETDASLLEINPFITTTDDKPARARLQDQLRRQRHLPPQRIEGTARHRRRRPPWKWKPRSTRSTTSSSTATSPAWSTAPAWPWPPWTSSSTPAARPPTSSMWAAAPTSSRSSTPSRSCSPTRTCRRFSSTSSAASCASTLLAHGVVEAAKKTNVKVPVDSSAGRHQRGAGTGDPAKLRPQLHHWRDHAGRSRQSSPGSQRLRRKEIVPEPKLCQC